MKRTIPTLILGALLGVVGTTALSAGGDGEGPSYPPYVPLDFIYLHDYGVYESRNGVNHLGVEFQLNQQIGCIPAGTWWRLDGLMVENLFGEWVAMGGDIGE